MRCHTATAWQPAKLTQHAFQLTHGGTEQLECQTCHLENFTEQTCYNCHDHQPEQMAVHQAEGIRNTMTARNATRVDSRRAAQLLEAYGDFSLVPAKEPGRPKRTGISNTWGLSRMDNQGRQIQ